MTRPREGSRDFSDSTRRSSRAERRRSSTPVRREPCAGRKCCIAVIVAGVVVAIGGGFVIGFFVYPYITAQSDESDGGVSAIGIQSDNDTETVLVSHDVINDDIIGQKRIEIDSRNCGKPTVESERIFQIARTITESAKKRDKRIVGGENSSLLNFPWQVSLWTRNHHTCGGSIISSNWIITAAHCTHAYPSPQNWTVYAGANTLAEMQLEVDGSQKFSLTDLVPHPEFDATTYDNDISLMRLERHIVMGDKVLPVCLPSSDEKAANGEECLISGWGALAEGGSMPKELQKATVGIIDLLVCNADDWLMGLVLDSMICAGTESGNMDACQGDSGGPLSCLRQSTGQFYLPGLVSWGIGCGEPKMPGVYTDVAQYKSWIVQSIQSVELKYS